MYDIKERYNNDPTFRAVVDMARQLIRSKRLTPNEINDAVAHAAILEEKNFNHIQKATIHYPRMERTKESEELSEELQRLVIENKAAFLGYSEVK